MKAVSTRDKKIFAAMKVYEDIALKLQHIAKAPASELSGGVEVSNKALSALREQLTDCADELFYQISQLVYEVYDEDNSDDENDEIFEFYGMLKYVDM